MVDALVSHNFPAGWNLELAGAIPPALADRLSASDGWEHVAYHGTVSPDKARDLVLSSRVGLVVLQDSLAYRDSLPTKMFEYFASGVPVIASDFPLWRSIIEEYDCGILVDEKSPSAIAAAVAKYDADPALLERHSNNARRVAVELLNWAHEEPTLESVYKRVIAA